MKALQQMTAVMRTSLLISSALAARASGFEYQNSYVVFLVKKKLRSVNPKKVTRGINRDAPNFHSERSGLNSRNKKELKSFYNAMTKV